MKSYCIYLRKSRADAEAEARGEGETLTRHYNMLMELAKKQKLNIVKIYKEIVSGDSIAARPQMQTLLA
ncbi:MAG: recombinase family protein, partial [Ruminococcus sp.]|nr:recombinase family protein [Ruminococcus sp.]